MIWVRLKMVDMIPGIFFRKKGGLQFGWSGGPTVDGRNPAPPGMVESLWEMGETTY